MRRQTPSNCSPPRGTSNVGARRAADGPPNHRSRLAKDVHFLAGGHKRAVASVVLLSFDLSLSLERMYAAPFDKPADDALIFGAVAWVFSSAAALFWCSPAVRWIAARAHTWPRSLRSRSFWITEIPCRTALLAPTLWSLGLVRQESSRLLASRYFSLIGSSFDQQQKHGLDRRYSPHPDSVRASQIRPADSWRARTSDAPALMG